MEGSGSGEGEGNDTQSQKFQHIHTTHTHHTYIYIHYTTHTPHMHTHITHTIHITYIHTQQTQPHTTHAYTYTTPYTHHTCIHIHTHTTIRTHTPHHTPPKHTYTDHTCIHTSHMHTYTHHNTYTYTIPHTPQTYTDHTCIHTSHMHTAYHTTHRAPRLHFWLFWGCGPNHTVGRRSRQPSTPSSAPAHVPSSFLCSPDVHFHSCLLYRSLVPLQDLEVLAALQDEDMARGPDSARRWATLAVLAALGTAVTATTNPGIVARVTQKGLDYGNWMPSFPSLPSLTEHRLCAAL